MVEDEDDMQATDSKYDRSSDAFGLESSLTSPRSDRDTSATSQSGVSYNSKPSLPAITELQDKLADLEATLDVKEAEVRDSTAEAEKWKMTTEALEKKLQAAEDLNKSLKEEIERLKVEQPSYSGESVLWKTKYLKLDQDHGALQGRLAQQQELTDEVRRQ
ncbi:component of the polarisome, partial [Exophiala xenobiotica]